MCSFVVPVLILFLGSKCQATNGFGYELLVERFDYLENSMKELQEMTRRELQKSHKAIEKLEETVQSELQEVKTMEIGITSCRKTPNNSESGRYKLKLMNTAFEVFCEQNLYGGGWIVIQNRFDGSMNFWRYWNDYRNGFGNLDGEFWFGLEKIHLITSSRNYDLMIHLEDFNGVVKYAYYKKFVIDSETQKYHMKSADFYNGTAGHSFVGHRYYYFSTKDRDNDADSSSNLAWDYDSGWWFYGSSNFNSNLNGLYSNEKGHSKMHWYTFNNDRQGLKVSKMMIRESLN